MNNTRRRVQKKRHRRRIQSHKRSILAIIGVLILLTAVLTVNGMTLRAKEKSYQVQIAELEEQIEEEQARAKEIAELEKYVGTDEYVEEVAKEKLGLVYEDEIIFKAE
jgi:cell division protein DivIC